MMTAEDLAFWFWSVFQIAAWGLYFGFMALHLSCYYILYSWNNIRRLQAREQRKMRNKINPDATEPMESVGGLRGH